MDCSTTTTHKNTFTCITLDDGDDNSRSRAAELLAWTLVSVRYCSFILLLNTKKIRQAEKQAMAVNTWRVSGTCSGHGQQKRRQMPGKVLLLLVTGQSKNRKAKENLSFILFEEGSKVRCGRPFWSATLFLPSAYALNFYLSSLS